MNDEDIKMIQTDDTAADDVEQNEITDEELEQFYEDNKDAIDHIGGLDMFESLMALDDESSSRKHFMSQKAFQSLELLRLLKAIHQKLQKQISKWQLML